MLLVAFAGAGFLIFVWLTPHGRPGRPDRPSAPTAAEEGGGVGEITTASPRAQVSGRRLSCGARSLGPDTAAEGGGCTGTCCASDAGSVGWVRGTGKRRRIVWLPGA